MQRISSVFTQLAGGSNNPPRQQADFGASTGKSSTPEPGVRDGHVMVPVRLNASCRPLSRARYSCSLSFCLSVCLLIVVTAHLSLPLSLSLSLSPRVISLSILVLGA